MPQGVVIAVRPSYSSDPDNEFSSNYDSSVQLRNLDSRSHKEEGFLIYIRVRKKDVDPETGNIVWFEDNGNWQVGDHVKFKKKKGGRSIQIEEVTDVVELASKLPKSYLSKILIASLVLIGSVFTYRNSRR